MSPSTHTNPHVSLRPPLDYLDHDRYARNRACSSFPRAFPIRTSQSHCRAALHSSSPYPPRSDHHLRRKPPGGIIETTYDRPSALITHRTSSREHLSPPASTNLGTYHPYTPSFPPPQPSQLQWTLAPRSFVHRNQMEGGATPWTTNNEPWDSYGTPQGGFGGIQHLSARPFTNQAPFPNIYQPVMRANEYNVRAFCPPPMPMSEALPFGYGGWQPSPSPWGYHEGIHTQFPGGSQSFYEHRMANRHGPSSAHNSYAPADYIHEPVRPGPAGFSSTVSFGFDAVANPVGLVPSPNAQQGFRQRAMAQAHQAYIDLISHLQAIRKSQENRSSCRGPGQSKILVYPKPPNPVPVGGFNMGPGTAFPLESHYPEGSGKSSVQSDLKHAPSGGPYGHQPNTLPSMGGGGGPAQSQFESAYPGWANATQNGYLYYASQARSSLGILNALCEQSGWKWTDGMLLGGCLHYGLESYDSALSWFSRVTVVDSRYEPPSKRARDPGADHFHRHVVALTNIAATLYCLGRPDEAEKNWLKAVNLCPGYLESTEHLVGLLYRKRSKEAVRIITYVQNALRLSHSEDKPHASAQTHGLGSSSQSTVGQFFSLNESATNVRW